MGPIQSAISITEGAAPYAVHGGRTLGWSTTTGSRLGGLVFIQQGTESCDPSSRVRGCALCSSVGYFPRPGNTANRILRPLPLHIHPPQVLVEVALIIPADLRLEGWDVLLEESLDCLRPNPRGFVPLVFYCM